MEAHQVEITEVVSANKKLQKKDAQEIALTSSKIIIAKGKSVKEFKGGPPLDPTLLPSMLGTTGNMRAPLIRVGKLTLVGFNEDVYRKHLL